MIKDAATVIGEETVSALKGMTIVPLLLSLQGAAALAAAGPPKLDVSETCEAASQFALAGSRDKEACFEDERGAANTVDRDWSKFSSNDKSMCVGMVTTGGPPSYVELLSCLEAVRDAKEMQLEDGAKQAEQPAPSRRRRR